MRASRFPRGQQQESVYYIDRRLRRVPSSISVFLLDQKFESPICQRLIFCPACSIQELNGQRGCLEAVVSVDTVRQRLDSTHWKRRLPTVAMLTGTAIGESYLRPVDY